MLSSEQAREFTNLIRAASRDELKNMSDLIWAKIKMLDGEENAIMRTTLNVGSRVRWRSRKQTQRGREYGSGVITQINRTRACVDGDDGVKWTVSFNMLERYDPEEIAPTFGVVSL